MNLNIQNFIDQPIQVLATIDLVEVDHDMGSVYQMLSDLKKDKFEPDEKIVILHNDTEYMYYGNPLGFTMHNLLRCWQALDIPYSVMVVVSNHNQLNTAVESFIVSPNDQPTIINSIVNNISYSNIKDLITADFTKDFKYPALSLLGIGRSHRIKLFQFLSYHNMFEQVKTNFSIGSNNKAIIKSSTPSSYQLDQIYTTPHRINESCFTHSQVREIVELSQIPVAPRSDLALTGQIQDFYNNFFLDVVTETVFDYPHQYVSEKTLRPLLMKTPFILFGAPGTLGYLRSLGFKTFEQFWDESYDTEQNHHLRFLKCCRIMQSIVDKPVTEFDLVYTQMLPILDHNRSCLIDYIEHKFKPLYKKITRDTY